MKSMNISLRKSIRSIMLVALLLGCVLSLPAQQVTQEVALKKAEQFLDKASLSRRAPRKAPQLTLANNRDEFYVFNDKANGGYVIVSGEERMPDVLAYSYDSRFDADNIPCNMKAWLEGYAEQVKYLRTHPEASARRATTERENVGPLLTCWFNQGSPYNDKCPEVDGNHCLTGCVATATAQVMYYWQWPKQTMEVIPAYQTNTLGINMSAQPITTIDWDNMLNQYRYGEEYSQEQIDAIATLMLLCGMSVQMDYNTNVSAAGGSSYALKKYFGYDELLDDVNRSAFDSDEWEQIIYDELNSRRPVLYGGGNTEGEGHGFVLDGYNDGFFHVNWGWGGVDSWVLMTDVEGWYGFVINHSATIGVQPSSPDFPSEYSVLDNGKLTLYYDKEKTSRVGMILKKEEWKNHAKDITTCVIDPSFSILKPKNLCAFFEGLSKLKSIEGIENLNTSMTWSMSYMFNGCSSLTNLDVSGFNTDKVTEMWAMFSDCSSLTSLDVSGFNTDKVTYMAYMFNNCSSLTSLDVSGFNTENAKDIGAMFRNCLGLTNLDLSGFNTEKVTSMWGMFAGCKRLSTIYANEKWKMSNVEESNYMFDGCSCIIGGTGTTYDGNHIDGEYARIDEGPSKPGYFTYKAPTSVIHLIQNNNQRIKWYTLDGRQIKSPQKGLNIMKKSDGKTRKVLVK